MPIDYDKMMTMPAIEIRHTFKRSDTILYALGIGIGAEAPTDPDSLRYLYEDRLEAFPTMAVVLGNPGLWFKDPQYGVDWKRIVHGEQSTVIHRTLPIEGEVMGTTRVVAIYDKGPDKGAVVCSTREVRVRATGDLIATQRMSSFLRGDGGFGGSSEGAPKPHQTPTARACDESATLSTRSDQALLYRLAGDLNPLHIDPEVAKAAGFPVPILHGLCTYGIVGRAVLKTLCGGTPQRLKRFDVRFSSPVFPGETLRVEVWREERGRAAVQARVLERDVIVLRNGLVEYDA
jgi:acyl dehydratase